MRNINTLSSNSGINMINELSLICMYVCVACSLQRYDVCIIRKYIHRVCEEVVNLILNFGKKKILK